MKILLDTHIALWAVTQSQSLTPKAKEILLSDSNEIYYSLISIWEVSLKHSINPANMDITAAIFRQLCLESGFIEMPIDYRHILGLDNLRQIEGMPVHKDPFDRLLLSQAIVENALFMTHDSKFPTFETSNLVIV